MAACCLAGCTDFSQHRFGGVRRENPIAEAPVGPAPALAIQNPPNAPKLPPNTGVQPATFVPDRAPVQPLVPNPALAQHPLRTLHTRAAQTYAGMDSYIFRFKRRESVAGKMQPEELILAKVRRHPFSVSLKWLGTEGKGREVVYVDGKYGNKMQVLAASGELFPFSPATRLGLSPSDPMVKAKSRHPITETGFGNLVDSYGRLVAAVEAGDTRRGTAKYLGQVKRDEFPRPLETVHQTLTPGAEPGLPKGGQRWWYFDPAHGLPVLVITHDETGEVEYYCHDLIQWPARLDDEDFNPDRMGRK